MGKMYEKLKKLNNNKSEKTLKGFYWGYNADKDWQNGYEFTSAHLIKQGISYEDTVKIGTVIKEASTMQWQGVMRKDPKFLEGKTKEQFIDEEWDRLNWVIKQQSITTPITVATYIEHAMIACCAISTLVAAGKIPQNKWNGDAFMESYEPGDFLKDLETA